MEQSVGVQVPLYPHIPLRRNGAPPRRVRTPVASPYIEEGFRLQVNDQQCLRGPAGSGHRVHAGRIQPHVRAGVRQIPPEGRAQGLPQGESSDADDQEALRQRRSSRTRLTTSPSDFYHKAMEEKDIHPVGQPTLVDMDFKRGRQFHFKIKYEVKPGHHARGRTGGSRSKSRSTT